MIERAGSTDLAMTAMGARGSVPEQMGVLLLLEGAVDPAALQATIAERIARVPRLRQRLRPVPPGCGRPVWVDDPAFDARAQVRRVTCPAPGDERALLDLAVPEVVRRLPRRLPPWRALVVTGLANGGAAVVLVVDHGVTDGLGGMSMLAALSDGAGHVRAHPAPRPRPSTARLAADAFATRLEGLRALPRYARLLRASLRAAGGFRPPPIAASSLLRRTGRSRRLEVVRTELAVLRTVAHRYGGTVNDALLTLVTGAVRTLLQSRGESPAELAVTIPATWTAGGAEPGNHIYPLVVTLPLAGPFGERLRRTGELVRERRTHTAGPPLVALAGPAFRVLARFGAYRWYLRHQRRTHTLLTNVRGPGATLRLGGAAVREIVPIPVGESGNMPVTFAALSYAGGVVIGVLADPAAMPDLHVLVRALRDEAGRLTR